MKYQTKRKISARRRRKRFRYSSLIFLFLVLLLGGYGFYRLHFPLKSPTLLWKKAWSQLKKQQESIEELLQGVVKEFGVPPQNISKIYYSWGGRSIVEERIKIPSTSSFILWNLAITKRVERNGGRVFWAVESRRGSGRLNMGLGRGSFFTHRLSLVKEELASSLKLSQVAILLGPFQSPIDEDWLNFDYPLSMAILPSSLPVFFDTTNKKKEILLHLPMEPKNYPEVDPGKEAIFVDLKEGEIKRRVRWALKRVPCAKGVINYLGSRATEDPLVMETVLKEIGERKLYFIDSWATSRSVGYDLAKKMGIRCAKPDLIINGDEARTIERKIERLAEWAEDKGMAFGIGQPKPEVLAALKSKIPFLERRGIKFVLVSEILK